MIKSVSRRIVTIAGLLAAVFLVAELSRPPADLHAQGYSNTNPAAYWVDPGKCGATASGSSTVTYTVDGASSTPVLKISDTLAVGVAHTTTFLCHIEPPSWIVTTGQGLQIVDAVFVYSPQNILGTQTAVLGSGTMNGSTVFGFLTLPTPAASETGSTITPARADSGTFVITPAVASFNVSTLTAGSYYTVKIAPAAGTLLWKTDLRDLIMTTTFTESAGLTTVITTPGVLVHYKSQ